MLPQAHLTSDSRMSGSGWVTTPPWLSQSLRSFLSSSSVHSYHLFLISSASVMCIPFLSFIVPIFAWTTRISNQSILKEISPIYSLEGLMLKFQHLGHLMSRIDSIEKKNPWFWERLKTGGEQDDRGWDGWMGRSWWWEAWHAEVHGVTKNQIQLSNWTELNLH